MLRPSIFGEDLFDSFFEDFNRPVRPGKPGMPIARHELMKTDVKETEEGFELGIELPGYNKEDITAELKEGVMTITASAKKEDEQKDENGKYIRRERFSGTCSRSFFVGKDLKKEDIKARFENGILKIDVPKKQPVIEAPEDRAILIEG